MAAGDVLTWVSGLLALADDIVARVGLTWAALHLGRRFDRAIELLERRMAYWQSTLARRVRHREKPAVCVVRPSVW